MSALDTVPAEYVTTAEEVVELTCDMEALIPVGEAAASCNVIVAQISTGDVVTTLQTPDLAGAVISQVIEGLVAGKVYRVRWLLTTDANTVRAATSVVRCEP